jgi:CDP-paratose 2-epimerase
MLQNSLGPIRTASRGELTPRLFDIPWVVMDAGLAQEAWKWEPASPLSSILDEIAQHAEQNPAWLEISAAL